MAPALRLAALVFMGSVTLVMPTACGSETTAESTGQSTGQSTDESGTTTIDITLRNGTVKPSGTEVKVARGRAINLHIVADKAGELHVHSTPEQQIAFKAGTTNATLTLDQPGVVDIEDHALDKLIVQLEVS